MKTTTFKGCTFTETETTTDVTRKAFGRRYSTTARIWRIRGRVAKGECVRPFLTSASACREYVREQDDRAE